MKLLGLDFESTWTEPVDVSKARITEIGAILYDWNTQTPLEILSQLVWDSSYPESPPELVELTGITDEMLRDRGAEPLSALSQLVCLAEEADFIVAHNGSIFDNPLLKHEFARQEIDMPRISLD